MNTYMWKAERIFTERIPTNYLTALRRSDRKSLGSFAPGITKTGALSTYSDHIAEVIISSIPMAPTTTGVFTPMAYGGYLVSEVGTPTPVPSPIVLSGKDRKQSNGHKWRNAPKTGDIVISDFERLRMMLTFTNGSAPTLGAFAFKNIGIDYIMAVLGIPKETDGKISYYDVGGEHLVRSGSGGVDLRYVETSFSDTMTVYDGGFTIKPFQDFLDSPKSWYSYDFHPEITKTLAEANMATLDVLTSLAEMPETVKSIYDGLKFMLKGLRDVKRKRFSILNKSKKLKIEYERRIFRSEYESRQQFLKARNDKARRTIANRAALKKKQLSNDLRNSLNALMTASANVWLTYRYSIETTVFMIEDAIDSLHFDKDKLFFRWKARLQGTLDLPVLANFTKKGVVNLEERVFIKRAFAKGSMFTQNLSASLFVTAWELIPLSFVLDWIINIGDFIATSTSSTLNKKYTEGSTLSLKPSGAITYNCVNGSSVTVELKGYKRECINPNDYCRLNINPDITGKRQIDALALSWGIFFKKVWKY